MEIIEFSPEYAEVLSVLYLESRKENFTWLNSDLYKLTDFDEHTEGERIHVAIEDGRVLGFISIWEPDDFIHHLYVANEAHDKGVGSRLLEMALSFNDRPLSLKCMAKNQKAFQFYVSRGFIEVSKDSDDLGEFYLMRSGVQ